MVAGVASLCGNLSPLGFSLPLFGSVFFEIGRQALDGVGEG